MWHSAHQQNHHGGGNECFDPGRDRCDDWNSDRGHHGGPEWNHGGGWGDPGCHDGGGWGGGWGGNDCHDGGGHGGLINFDHNSFLACH